MTPDEWTSAVANKSGPNANPRAKVIFASLVKHMHSFCREVQLTNEEWMLACEELIAAGQISDGKRNELILISDVLGIESLVDSMAQERLIKESGVTKDESGDVTFSAILGPFYRDPAPHYKNGESMTLTTAPNDVTAHLFGTLKDVDGKPLVGAKIDIWHTGSHGFYDSQVYDPKDETTLPYNWRGVYTTDEEGKYDCYCLKPTPYPIPYDSAAGHILQAMDNSEMRPAHIHFFVRAAGYAPLITQIYDKNCKYIDSDAVFGVKDQLVVEFKPIVGNDKAVTELEYNIVLAKPLTEEEQKKVGSGGVYVSK